MRTALLWLRVQAMRTRMRNIELILPRCRQNRRGYSDPGPSELLMPRMFNPESGE
jgi:hypothetical protein